MKFIKFTKNHPVGINKGEHRKIKYSSVTLKIIKEKYAEECSEKDFDSWKKEFTKKREEEAEIKAEEIVKKNEKRASNLSREIQPEDEDNDNDDEEAVEEEKVYLTITKEDLESTTEFGKRGLKEGDEIELNADGIPVRNVNNHNFIKKEGNEEASSENGATTAEENGDGSEENSENGGDGANSTGDDK